MKRLDQRGAVHLCGIIIFFFAMFGIWAAWQSYQKGALKQDVAQAFDDYKALALKAVDAPKDRELIAKATSVGEVQGIVQKYAPALAQTLEGASLKEKLEQMAREIGAEMKASVRR